LNYTATFLSETQAVSQTANDISTVGEMTDGVTNVAKAISDFGPVVVIMAVFIVIFLVLVLLVLRNNSKMMNQLMKRQDNYDKTDQQILNKFLETALASYTQKSEDELKHVADDIRKSLEPLEHQIESINDRLDAEEEKHEKEKEEEDDIHKDLVGTFIDVNMAFKDASRTAFADLGCERVAIYVFHNGNNSIHGLPFFKMSCIHEWTTKGSNTLRGKYHIDIPLHLFNDFIEDLWKDGYYAADDIERAKEEDKSISEFTAFSNTRSIYILGIRDSDNKLAGFVVAEFAQVDTFKTNPERGAFVSNILNEMISKIGPIVTNHYLYKGKSKE